MSVIVQTPDGPKPTMQLSSGRSTGLATSSVPFSPARRQGIGLVAGRTISFAKLWRSQPWVAVSANRLAEQCARLPLHTFAYVSPDQDARRRVRDHDVAKLLSKPRPRVPGVLLRWGISLGLKVHGNHVLYKRRLRPGAPPYELWPLDYRLLVPHLDGDTGVVVMWEWQGAGVPDLKRGQFIDPHDVVHFAWGSTDGQLGVSPLEHLGVTLRSEDAIQRFAEASFRNGTRMGVAAILDKNAKAGDAAKRDGVREELMAAHGGVDQAFRPAILGGGIIDLKPIGGQTAAEAELIEQRKVNREECAAVYGIPQPLAGILDHATYSNIESLLGALFTVYLAPENALTTGILQAQLVDEEPAWAGDGVFVEHNLGEVLRGDVLKRYQAYSIALQRGFKTLNGIRDLENDERYEDPLADEPLVLGNNVLPLSKLGAAAANGAAGGRRASDTGDNGGDGAAALAAVAISELLESGTSAVELEHELVEAFELAGHNGSSGALARQLVAALIPEGEES